VVLTMWQVHAAARKRRRARPAKEKRQATLSALPVSRPVTPTKKGNHSRDCLLHAYQFTSLVDQHFLQPLHDVVDVVFIND